MKNRRGSDRESRKEFPIALTFRLNATIRQMLWDLARRYELSKNGVLRLLIAKAHGEEPKKP